MLKTAIFKEGDKFRFKEGIGMEVTGIGTPNYHDEVHTIVNIVHDRYIGIWYSDENGFNVLEHWIEFATKEGE